MASTASAPPPSAPPTCESVTTSTDFRNSPGRCPNEVEFLAGLLRALLSGEGGLPCPLPSDFSAALLKSNGDEKDWISDAMEESPKQGIPAYPLYKRLAQELRDWIVTGAFPRTLEAIDGIAEDEDRTRKIAHWSVNVEKLGSLLLKSHRDVDAQFHVQEPYFSQLKAGTKIVEGRCATGAYNKLQVGDTLLFNQSLLLNVKDVKKYSTFLEMLHAEGLDNVLPGVSSVHEGVKVYRAFYSEEREQAGVLSIHVSQPYGLRQPFEILHDLLKELDVGGVRTLLGMRSTMGSIEDALPPPTLALLSSFSFAHHTDLPGSKLTVGARALAKHVHRSRDGWWGSFTGTETNKNQLAYNKIHEMMDNAIWLNVHKVPVPVFELRVHDGYGARWSADGTQFRGFLEPPMEEGYLNKWRH